MRLIVSSGLACVLLVCGGPRAWPQSPAPVAYKTVRITDRVYEFSADNNNSMFIVTPAGVIVTDPIAQRHPEIAQRYMAEIRKITSAPIRYLIYSHSHFSRTAGGKVFKDAGAIVIAQRHGRDRLRRITTPEIVPVDEVVDQHRTIELGGTTLDLIYLGPNHSDNALVMLLPRERIIYAVDWIGATAPHTGGLGGDSFMPEWEEGARQVATMEWDRMIVGHGPALATKANVRMLVDYLQDAKSTARGMADRDQCTVHDVVARPAAIPEKYRSFTDQVSWDAVLNRYCVYWNQGY